MSILYLFFFGVTFLSDNFFLKSQIKHNSLSIDT